MNKLFLYNTLSRKKEEFKPIKTSPRPSPYKGEGVVGLYTCGLTVYNYAHLGNLRTYLFEDILKRVLIYNGYKVKHVMNITDVGHLTGDRDMGEDKLEVGAKRERKTAWEIVAFYTKAFEDDIKKLNILEPDIWCKATDYIKEQIELIKILEAKGYTYKISDGVYYNTAKFKDYTKLSRQNLEALKAGARIEKNEEKKNATDFALWKFSHKIPLTPFVKGGEKEIPPTLNARGGEIKKRQMEWDSPWGVGFPGWHIECSAMSLALLKNQRDIHCGGVDHINVHHTNEIAQSQAATGEKFFNFWLHGAFLNIAGGEKMAKSAENFLTLENALIKIGVEPLAFRLACLQTHYRKPMEYSETAILNAEKGLRHLYNQIKELRIKNYELRIKDIDKKFKNKFLEAINDDLNMPRALAIAQELLKSKLATSKKLDAILDFDRVWGLNLANALRKEEAPAEIGKMIKAREKVRQERNFKESDRLREKIEKLGYVVEDTKDGQRLSKK